MRVLERGRGNSARLKREGGSGNGRKGGIGESERLYAKENIKGSKSKADRGGSSSLGFLALGTISITKRLSSNLIEVLYTYGIFT